MDANEIVKTLAGKVYGMPDEQITSTFFEGEGDGIKLKEDAVTILLNQDVERIKKMKETHAAELTVQDDHGYKRATKEHLSKWEEKIKAETGYTGNETGIALVKAIAKLEAGKSGKDPKLSEEYITLERKFNETDAAWKTRLEEEIGKVKGEYEKKIKLDRIGKDALTILMELKPATLSQNETIRNTQLANFLREFDPYDYEVDSKGDHIISEEGKRKDDQHGKPYKFKDLVMDISKKHFEFEKQEPRGSSGTGSGQGNSSGASGVIPETWGEFQKAVAEETDPKKRAELWDAWEKKNKK